jgi:putative hemolysin
MGTPQINFDAVCVRLARGPEEIRAAQRLRYKVFYEEYRAIPDEEMARERRDADAFDAVADHLIVIDESCASAEDGIVGTYRLIRQEAANQHGRFYTSGEYDIGPLQNAGSLLELGRSCVLAEYRTRPVLQLLWQGILDYVLATRADVLFGCASLVGTDVKSLSQQLAYLYHYHLAPAEMRPRALSSRYVDMNLHAREDINVRKVFSELPPLIKGYLRVGAFIGDGAVVDDQFNTTDVCIVMPTSQIATRYRKHYSRKLNRPYDETAPAGDDFAEKAAESLLNGTMA